MEKCIFGFYTSRQLKIMDERMYARCPVGVCLHSATQKLIVSTQLLALSKR
jgi:hypothetical protein